MRLNLPNMRRRRVGQVFQSVKSVGFRVVWLCWLAGPWSLTAQETDLDAVRERAEAHYQTGRWLEALADFERLVSLYPEEGCLHGRLAGCALREPGRLSMARRHLRIAIRKACSDVDLEFHRARLAQLEYDFDRAADLYTAYLATAGKKARFGEEANTASMMCQAVQWSPDEAVGLQVLDRIPADPDAAFRFYRPETPGLRLVSVPAYLRSKADAKVEAGRMAFHDGDTLLVYGSLGKNGKNGWDLVSIRMEAGGFGEPIPLGDSINTAFNERDAFLSQDGILYFSSDRPGGLGGYDIYAIPWSGAAFAGQPERLPFPINSVNDDAFFIPEPDGGAWFASNRAASDGQVHAFRVALQDKPFEAGTVAWIEEEVETAGLSLRVYQQGDILQEVGLAGAESGHLLLNPASSDEGVRVALVNRNGDIVAETFGAADGAWELRKEGRGWNFSERVQPDWAMVANLQADGQGLGAAGTPSAGQGDQGSPLAWGTWVQNRRSPEPQADNVALVAGEAEEAEDVEDASQAEVVSDLPVQETLPPNESSPESIEVNGLTESALPERTAEEWAAVIPKPAEYDRLRADNPELVTQIKEQATQKLLAVEQSFLDNPDMAQAGEVYDALDVVQGWMSDVHAALPSAKVDLDTDGIRVMLDNWSEAVQSAEKADLAELAEDAVLAERREKLAIRELQRNGGPAWNELTRRWADHRAAQASNGADFGTTDWTMEEGDQLFLDVDAVLSSGKGVWSRKELAGWRGDWLDRQRRQWQAHEALWESEREAILKSQTDMADATSAPGEGAQNEGEVRFEALEDPLGEDGSEALVGYGFRSGLNAERSIPMATWRKEMARDVSGNEEVEKAWRRFASAAGRSAVPQIENARDLMGLDEKVASRWVDLRQAMLEAWEIGLTERSANGQIESEAELEEWRASGALKDNSEWKALELALSELDMAWKSMEGARTTASELRSTEDKWDQQEVWLAAGLKRAEAAQRVQAIWSAQSENWRVAIAAEEAAALAAAEEAAARVAAEEAAARAAAEEAAAQAAAEEAAALAAAEEAAALAAAEEAAPQDLPFPRDWSPTKSSSWTALLEEATAQWSQEGRDQMALTMLPEDLELMERWKQWEELIQDRPGVQASARDQNAWEKRRFLAQKQFRTAISSLDSNGFRSRLRAGEELMDQVGVTPVPENVETADAASAESTASVNPEGNPNPELGVDNESASPVTSSAPSADRASQFGVVLPAAEVVGAGATGSTGVQLRPISREEMERAILSKASVADPSVERAAEAFSEGEGAPRLEGVEYKVQIGAFRNPLPAALFAAFDPMWAKTSASGITRYMAGSFDAYDPAVEARDAIRALGYADAFVVRFMDGERVRGARPAPAALAEERREAEMAGNGAREGTASSTADGVPSITGDSQVREGAVVRGQPSGVVPTRPEEIESWTNIRGRVYSVQIGAFRGVPDERALADLGQLTRENAGSDGWLRLFSGRFESESEARDHLAQLRASGRNDAFVVVYINGRRIPLLEASTTATSGTAALEGPTPESQRSEQNPVEVTVAPVEPVVQGWKLQLGAFSSTIPVRLANAILDAPLEWEVQSVREGGLTRYVTRAVSSETQVRSWLESARDMGFQDAVAVPQD